MPAPPGPRWGAPPGTLVASMLLARASTPTPFPHVPLAPSGGPLRSGPRGILPRETRSGGPPPPLAAGLALRRWDRFTVSLLRRSVTPNRYRPASSPTTRQRVERVPERSGRLPRRHPMSRLRSWHGPCKARPTPTAPAPCSLSLASGCTAALPPFRPNGALGPLSGRRPDPGSSGPPGTDRTSREPAVPPAASVVIRPVGRKASGGIQPPPGRHPCRPSAARRFAPRGGPRAPPSPASGRPGGQVDRARCRRGPPYDS
jgi:hypothetical protein